MSTSDVTVTLSRELWEALLSAEPIAKESYTGDGETLFAAYAGIHQAVDEPSGDGTVG